jgi:hypothetical protein
MQTTLVFQLPAEEFPQALATPFSHLHLMIASTFKRTATATSRRRRRRIGH